MARIETKRPFNQCITARITSMADYDHMMVTLANDRKNREASAREKGNFKQNQVNSQYQLENAELWSIHRNNVQRMYTPTYQVTGVLRNPNQKPRTKHFSRTLRRWVAGEKPTSQPVPASLMMAQTVD